VPIHRRVRLHRNGPALWPTHKPELEVIDLKANTPPHIWTATYQGIPTAPGGTVFKRHWWGEAAGTRYDYGDRGLWNKNLRRWISCDTAGSLSPTAAWSAFVVSELTRDYRLVIKEVVHEKMEFPSLVSSLTDLAIRSNHDGKLAGIIVENKSARRSSRASVRRGRSGWPSCSGSSSPQSIR
jgi:hypothetical protein